MRYEISYDPKFGSRNILAILEKNGITMYCHNPGQGVIGVEVPKKSLEAMKKLEWITLREDPIPPK